MPQLAIRDIIKIQALWRGALVRKKRFPAILEFHEGAVRTVDSMVDHYVEDVFIPDLLLEILSKNRVYENFDLYSDESRILYEIRGSYMDKVVREMIKETV